MKDFLTTPFGGFCKVFLSCILTQYFIELQQGHDLFSLDLVMVKKLLTAALISNLPIIINWLNPQYTAYGKTEKNG